MRTFQIIALTPANHIDPAIAIAAGRAGALGVLNLEHADIPAARQAISQMARYAAAGFGLRLGNDPALLEALIRDLPRQVEVIILACSRPDYLAGHLRALRAFEAASGRELRLLVEVSSQRQAEFALEAAASGLMAANGLIARGNEAGGWVGDETTFILLQRLIARFDVPIWASGGIGLHAAAACYVAGAAGVVLDDQLALTRESQLPQAIKSAVAAMDGSETIELRAPVDLATEGDESRPLEESGGVGHCAFRVYQRPGASAVAALSDLALALSAGDAPLEERRQQWREAVSAAVGAASLADDLWPLGQAAAFAAPLAERFHTVGGIIQAMRRAVQSHLEISSRLRPLDADSPLAQSHRTRYPIVQGPMTRVSDRAEFALRVAENGGLPFLALALMRAQEVEALLQETRQLLGDLPWGVGILGFVPLELRQEQLEVIRRVRPPFALIAGGRPDQALALEKEGIPTYLHVPSPGLLRLFLKDGVRRFVFEGRECGGHVGPRSSFVLWDTMVEVLLEELGRNGGNGASSPSPLADCHVLYAGGIHDRLSAAMVAALSAPLVDQGARIGVLMGTAYLFTQEAVESGGILPGFQEEAIRCQQTVLLESGPGHATRCVPTRFVHDFEQEKARLLMEGNSSADVRHALELLNVGRLRIASKGITRHPDFGADPAAPKYVTLDPEDQHRDGMYMIGQVAALRDRPCTMGELHEEVAVGSARVLEELSAADQSARPSVPHSRPSGIAIVGMSVILPGAGDLRSFWENVLNRVSAITQVPQERWDASLYYDADRAAPDKIYSIAGGFIDDVIFDPLEFGIPPNSLPSIDPLHLLALLAAREALADAGYAHRPFDRLHTSVILGASGGTGDLGANYLLRSGLPSLFGEAGFDMAQAAAGFLPEWTEDSFPGLLLNVAAGRIANRLDLGGLNYIVDAACASSLTAVHLAVKELETHNTNMAIVGGVDTVQNPFGYLCFSKTQALSPTGQPRVFDASGDGIVISEGVAMLVLKRVEDAERDGDRIYAVISAVGGSSDGRAMGMTAPRPEGQRLALDRAYARAGISPTTVGLFEAHGTGTVVGDRTEAISLGDFLTDRGASPQSHALGSVKSMIGHTKATAGVAGLIKVASALYHKVLPPTLGVTEPNPKAGLDKGPLYVNSEARPWIHAALDYPRRAGVSAFGFGGTNFHAVLEEYTGDFLSTDHPAATDSWPSELLLWTAASPASLRDSVAAMLRALQAGATPRLRDLAFSLWAKRGSAQAEAAVRLAVVAASLPDLAQKLEAAVKALDGSSDASSDAPSDGAGWQLPGVYYAPRPLGREGTLAFLFPGQGSQTPNMLRDLAIQFPAVRETFERGDRALDGRFPRPLSHFVFPPPAFTPEGRRAQEAALTATNVAQPALGAADMALVALLRQMGLPEPGFAAGHSYGEYVALAAAGVIDEETLFHLSEARGRFIIEAAEQDLGTMAAVRAGAEETQAVVGSLEDVWLANFNAPNQTIISGSREGIEAAVSHLKAAGLQAQPIPVACAFHSPLVAPARQRLAGLLDQTPFSAPRFSVYANSSAERYPLEPEGIRDILSDHLVRPVRFADQITAMYDAGARIFVEVGPRNVLTGLAHQILADRPFIAIPMDQPGRHGLTGLQHALGQLAAHGLPLCLEPLYHGRDARLIDLETLELESPPPPPSATAWLVNGSRARPLRGEPDPPRKPPLAAAASQVASSPVSASSPIPPAAPAASPGPQPAAPVPSPQPADDVAQVMLQYQQTMERFLETQRNVMLSYLHGGSGAPTGYVPPAAPQPAAAAPRAELPAPAAESAASSPEPIDTPSVADKIDDDAQLPAALPTRDELARHLRQIVSERTGYPPDMLDMNVDIEADLGIDSIKRVEILGILQGQVIPPGLELAPEAMEELTGHKTLQGVVDWLDRALRSASLQDAAAPEREPATELSPPPAPPEPAPAAPPAIGRYLMTAVQVPSLPKRVPQFDPARPLLVTDDGRGIARAFVERVRRLGGEAILIAAPDASTLADLRLQPGPVAGLVHLAPLAPEPGWSALDLSAWRSRLRRDVKSLFLLARETAADLKSAAAAGRAWVIAAGIGGDDAFPGHAGLAGFLKSLALEWPEVACKAIRFDQATDSEALISVLLAEMAASDNLVEITYDGRRRLARQPAAVSLPAVSSPAVSLDPDSVLLLTGGARGITAEIACLLAEQARPTLLLVGRAPAPPAEEPPHTAGLVEARDLKAALMAQLQASDGVGRSVPLAAVEEAYRSLLKEREIRRNLERIRAAGSAARYFQADVTDEPAMTALLEGIYQEYGRLDGVIHGAGIIEDKLVEAKEPASFDRVFDTKADSAFILGRALRPDSLRFLAFFTSAAGSFGNRGQSDYAATNELVNQLAAHLDRRWPGRVLALNWGPWDKKGMVSEALRQEFARRDIALIPIEEGCRIFLDELARGRKGEVQLVIGGGVWGAAAAAAPLPALTANGRASLPLPLLHAAKIPSAGGDVVEALRLLDPAVDLYLSDHRLDGKPVFPVAMAMELMAEVVQHGWPDLHVAGLRDLQVLHGIVVDNGPLPVRVLAQPGRVARNGRPGADIQVQLLDAASGRAYYRAVVEVTPDLTHPPAVELPAGHSLAPFPMSVAEAYDRWLFHGPLFQGIETIRGISPSDLVATCAPSLPQAFLADSPGGEWLIDPVVFDSALQLIILWTRHYRDATPLPSRFGRYRRYGSLSHSPITCHLQVPRQAESGLFEVDIAFVDAGGRLVGMLEKMECPASKAFNRLAGRASA